jgi:PAS domain S-box-containing protein
MRLIEQPGSALLNLSGTALRYSFGTGSPVQYSAFQNANVWLAVIDPYGRILEWNKAAEEISGYATQDVIGKNDVWKNLYPDAMYRKTITGTIKRIIGDKQFFENFETIIRTKTGGQKTISWNTRAIPDANGTPVSFVVIGIDITERKQLEQNLTLAIHKWESTFNAISDGICLIGADQKIERCNRQMSGILGGVPVEELVGRSCFEIIHETSGPIPTCPFVTAKKTLRRSSSEVYERGRWFEVTADPVLDCTGAFAGAIHIMRDITERKRVDNLLQENQLKLGNAMDLAKIVNWEYDVATGEFIFDDRFYALFSTTAEREGGHRMSAETYAREFVLPEDIPAVAEAIRKLLETTDPLFRGKMEHRIIRRDREIRTISVQFAPVMDAYGKVIRTFGANQDVTERKMAEEALRESEQKFRDIFNNITDAIHIHEIKEDGTIGGFTDVNDVACQMLGYTREEMLGKTPRDIIPDYHNPPVEKVVEEQRTTGNTRFETEHRAKDGTIIPVEISTHVVIIQRKKVMLAVVRDVTERKHMEKALRDSWQLFADIISFLPDSTFVIDTNGKVLAWNRALEQLSGVKAADMIGKGDHEYSIWIHGKRQPVLIDLVQDPDQNYNTSNYRVLIKEGHTIMAEIDLIYLGKKITLSLVASPFLNPEGKIIGSIESMRDISRIKETEAELANINAHLETLVKERTHALEEEVVQRQHAEQEVKNTLRYTQNLIEANPDLMLILDIKGIIRGVNTATEQATGLPRKNLIGTSYNNYLVDNRDAVANLARILREGFLKDIPYEIRHVDGRITPILASSQLQRDTAGAVEYIITAAHDITRQKKDAEVIQASLAEKEILLREVHHRVKNNLQIIISLINLQRRQTDDPNLKQFLMDTNNRIRAMALVHQKLYQSESLSHIDLADYLRYLSTQIFSYYSVNTQRVNLVVEIETISIDINRAIPIGLIMNELVSNALKHAFPGDRNGTITLTGRLEDNLLTLTVSDDGVGMPPAYDWKNTKTLGLRLINILADQIGGTITLGGTQGTTFIMTVRLNPSEEIKK